MPSVLAPAPALALLPAAAPPVETPPTLAPALPPLVAAVPLAPPEPLLGSDEHAVTSSRSSGEHADHRSMVMSVPDGAHVGRPHRRQTAGTFESRPLR
jgi:hypothetical protein